MENVVNPRRWREIEVVGDFIDTGDDAKWSKVAIGKLVEGTTSNGMLTA